MATVSAIIISYNGREFLRKSLRALEASEARPSEIIAVDDHSSDGTAEMARKEFPFITFVQNEKNLGPTASRNRGATRAVGDYLLFLDNDTLVRPDAIKKMVAFLESTPDAGLCGAKILEDERNVFWNMGYDPNSLRGATGATLGFLRDRFPRSAWLTRLTMRFDLNHWDYDRTILVDWVIERCFIIRRTLWESLGGMDERFVMFFEGPDMCRRVRAAGKKVYFLHSAAADTFPDGHTHSDSWRTRTFLQSEYRYYQKYYFYLRSNPVFFWLARIPRFALRQRPDISPT